MKIRPVGADLFHAGRWTGVTKLIVAFRNFANAPKNKHVHFDKNGINPLNPELNPICYLLALLGAHHFLHVTRIRVKLLTFRLLMSYIWSTHS